ncbi:MAG: hypothetical protein WC867_06650 [Candidatus Pacearchaeota archaeon]|jgi:hypothetical protein
MNSAILEIKKNNYEIISSPIDVPNMRSVFDSIDNLVSELGGSNRGHFLHPYQHHEFVGYYNVLSFSSEFFLNGVIINLKGTTDPNDSTYFVNPRLSNLERDLRSPSGVCLADIDKYSDYERDKRLGFNEQVPKFTDRGSITYNFEGTIKTLNPNSPDFYKITGLPKKFQPEFKLLSKQQYKDEEEENLFRDYLYYQKNIIKLSREDTLSECEDFAKKYPDIFNEVFK